MASDDYMYYYGGATEHDGGLSRLSRLSIESTDGDDADAELSDADKGSPAKRALGNDDDDDEDSDRDIRAGVVSLPGTPERRRSAARPIWVKGYASDAEARGRRKGKGERKGRERVLDRAWEMRRCRAAAAPPDEAECRVLVRPRGKDTSMRMDMEEVRACRDLGLELPCDWTVEIPYAFSGDTSSGGDSPVAAGSWRISSPGDNPKDVKARLKVWAQAVALASASGHSA